MSSGSIPFSVMHLACIGGSPHFYCSDLRMLDVRMKKKILLDYNFVTLKHSLSSRLVLRAATYKGDHFYQTLTPMSKEAFLIDILGMESTH